ncbi:MAG: hypothetical protein SV062_08425, partial [Thermodesulfobacteriota bacterium]|nr:hypothetical protein [Thermodesulfobacteriota bacterium]
MNLEQKGPGRMIHERMAEENHFQECIDKKRNRWQKIYFSSEEHCRNWIEQLKEFGEAQVEEVYSRGVECSDERGGELYMVWWKMDETRVLHPCFI